VQEVDVRRDGEGARPVREKRRQIVESGVSFATSWPTAPPRAVVAGAKMAEVRDAVRI